MTHTSIGVEEVTSTTLRRRNNGPGVRDYRVLQEALNVHFQHQYKIGLLTWPKAFSNTQIKKLWTPSSNFRSANIVMGSALYSKPSNC